MKLILVLALALVACGRPNGLHGIEDTEQDDGDEDTTVVEVPDEELPPGDEDVLPEVDVCDPDRENDCLTVCHKGKSLALDANALEAHLRHGDTEGACQ